MEARGRENARGPAQVLPAAPPVARSETGCPQRPGTALPPASTEPRDSDVATRMGAAGQGLTRFHLVRCKGRIAPGQQGDFPGIKVADAGAAIPAGTGVGKVDAGEQSSMQDGLAFRAIDPLLDVGDLDTVRLWSAGHVCSSGHGRVAAGRAGASGRKLLVVPYHRRETRQGVAIERETNGDVPRHPPARF